MPPSKRPVKIATNSDFRDTKKPKPNQNELPTLPLPVLAHILSYHVRSVMDLAQVRLILPSIVRSISENHWIQCPSNQGFYTSLADATDTVYEEHGISIGQVIFCEDESLVSFPDCQLRRIRILGEPKPVATGEHTEKDTGVMDPLAWQSVHAQTQLLCQKLDAPTSVEQFEKYTQQVHRLGLLNPITRPDPGNQIESVKGHISNYFLYPVMITIKNMTEMETSGSVIKNSNGTKEIIASQGDMQRVGDIPDWHIPFFMSPTDVGCSFSLYPSDDDDESLGYILVHLMADKNRLKQYLEGEVTSDVNYRAAWKDFQRRKLVEGVAIVDGALEDSAKDKLNREIEQFYQLQQSRGMISTESDFRGKIRFYVNPNLFCYTRGITELRANPHDVPPCNLAAEFHPRSEKEDFWGRLYHKPDLTKFQYLPTYVTISEDGTCSFENYINHITPKEDFSEFYDALASILQVSLPFMESVLSHARNTASAMFTEKSDDWDQGGILNDNRFVSLRGQRVQVILQIFEECLRPGETIDHRDNHVEGMPHEEILLSVAYVTRRDPSASRGCMQFQRPLLKDEVAYLRNVSDNNGLHSRDGIVVDGMVPLGQVDILDGRLFVAPNSHIRQWCGWKNTSETETAMSRKVIFHLINPTRRIVSTREVAPQQEHSAGTMSVETARQLLQENLSRRNEECQYWNDPDLSTLSARD